MKLTTLILITAILQVSANSFAQKITLSERKAPLLRVLDEISNQSGYDFVFSSHLLKRAKQVDINVQNAELEEVLTEIFGAQPFDYEIQEKMVILVEKNKSFVDELVARFQQIDVRGRIVNEEGTALEGATVTVKGTSKVVLSDVNGRFLLENIDEKAVLVVSYLGYGSKEIAAVKDIGTIQLSTTTGELEEVNVVVNTGYQQLSKERATGSFEQIDQKIIDRGVSANIFGRLDGLSPVISFDKRGYNINATENAPNLLVRGLSTINANSAPLVVLDNFPFEGNINSINPNDIASITILKDAVAASIWGARAGNGVIVITTKKGRLATPLRLNFNSNINITGKPDLMAYPSIASSAWLISCLN